MKLRMQRSERDHLVTRDQIHNRVRISKIHKKKPTQSLRTQSKRWKCLHAISNSKSSNPIAKKSYKWNSISNAVLHRIEYINGRPKWNRIPIRKQKNRNEPEVRNRAANLGVRRSSVDSDGVYRAFFHEHLPKTEIRTSYFWFVFFLLFF